MPYKDKRKQKKFAREWTRSKRAGKKWRGAKGLRMKVSWVPFKGLEKIGNEKVKRRAAVLPRKTKSTWLKKPLKYPARNGRKPAEIIKHSASIRKAMK
jgi:hypothetical protein